MPDHRTNLIVTIGLVTNLIGMAVVLTMLIAALSGNDEWFTNDATNPTKTVIWEDGSGRLPDGRAFCLDNQPCEQD